MTDKPTSEQDLALWEAEFGSKPRAPGHPKARTRPPMSWKSRAYTIISLVVVPLVLIIGLLAMQSTPDDTPAAIVRAAPQHTVDAGTARVTYSLWRELSQESQEQARLEGVQSFEAAARQLTNVGAAIPMVDEIRVVDGALYVRDAAVALPAGKQWVAVTAEEANAAGFVLEPAGMLNHLTKVNGAPVSAGREDMDGTPVEVYQFTMDLSDDAELIARVAAGLDGSLYGQSPERFTQFTDLDKVPGEAWIDNDGRVRRFTYTVTTAAVDARAIYETVEVRYGAFGEPVTVAVPPPAEVVPYAEVSDYFTQARREVDPPAPAG
jgi:hypothetical protein